MPRTTRPPQQDLCPCPTAVSNVVGTRNDGVIVVSLRKFPGIRMNMKLSGLRPRHTPPAEQVRDEKPGLATFGPLQGTIVDNSLGPRGPNVPLLQRGVGRPVHLTPASLSTSGMTDIVFPIARGEPLTTSLVAYLDGEWSTIRLA